MKWSFIYQAALGILNSPFHFFPPYRNLKLWGNWAHPQSKSHKIPKQITEWANHQFPQNTNASWNLPYIQKPIPDTWVFKAFLFLYLSQIFSSSFPPLLRSLPHILVIKYKRARKDKSYGCTWSHLKWTPHMAEKREEKKLRVI